MTNKHGICSARCPLYVLSYHEDTKWPVYCRRTADNWKADTWAVLSPTFYKGEVCPLDRWEVPSPTCPHRLTVGCCQTECVVNGGECDNCKDQTISIIIPVADESMKELETTVRTLKRMTAGPLEWIFIDDASKVPLVPPTCENAVLIRNEKRLGATQSRRLGVERATGKFVYLPDAHMRYDEAGSLRKLCAVAASKHCLAYCGTKGDKSRATACSIKWHPKHKLLECKWDGSAAPGKMPARTTGMMGANYIIERQVLLDAGGWVGLPGERGSQELAQSINLQRHGVELWCVPELVNSTWHHYRTSKEAGAKMDAKNATLNRVLAHRWMFSGEVWGEFKKVLQSSICRTGAGAAMLAKAEKLDTPMFRDGFVDTDREFLGRIGLSLAPTPVRRPPAKGKRKHKVKRKAQQQRTFGAPMLALRHLEKMARKAFPSAAVGVTGSLDGPCDPPTIGSTTPETTPEEGEPPLVTCVLLNWMRPDNIPILVKSIRDQTRPAEISLWNNGKPLPPVDVNLLLTASVNQGCFPRWLLAALTKTEWIVVVDDDLAFKSKEALGTLLDVAAKHPDSITGVYGVELVKGKTYEHQKHWSNRDAEVDIVKGRILCFRRRLLKHVPLCWPGVDTFRCDDIYLSHFIPGRHYITSRLKGMLRSLDAPHALSTKKGHATARQAAVMALWGTK